MPEPELADIIRRFGPAYEQQSGGVMLPSQRRALRDIEGCMTPAMGGGRYSCGDCGESFWSYHGCRNRACPKCHGRQTADWLQKREAEMLPCDYFHVVATVPGELRRLFLRHQKILYGLLMKTAAEAVRDLAAEKHYVGAEVGILAVLHTWTGELHHHPHIHMLVTGGGVSVNGAAWHDAPAGFLVPAKKLSPMISRRFAEALRKNHPDLFGQIPAKVWKRKWCSFCKHFGAGRDAVLQYLARYVFRIAISNARILAMDESHVTFRHKDHDTGNWKTQRVEGVEFLRRFLMHVLPRGFHKVRYYGLWHSSRRASQNAARCFLLLRPCACATDEATRIADLAEDALAHSELEAHAHAVICPACASRNVVCLESLRRSGRTSAV